MKVLTLLAAGALLLVSQTFAAPMVEPRDTTDTAAASDSDSASAGKSAAASTAVNYGSPRCKSAALYDLCTANNADAYCDGTGFHCNFMASCKRVCWCE